MSLKKKYYTENGICKVTFILPGDIAESAKTASLVGEFNNWDSSGLQMRKRNGKFTLSIELKSNKQYQFRYLVNGNDWESDWQADGLAPIPFEYEEFNSVVRV